MWRRSPWFTSGLAPVPSSGLSNSPLPLQLHSNTRVASSPGCVSARNCAVSPASCSATWPLCSWMSNMPPRCRGVRAIKTTRRIRCHNRTAPLLSLPTPQPRAPVMSPPILSARSGSRRKPELSRRTKSGDASGGWSPSRGARRRYGPAEVSWLQSRDEGDEPARDRSQGTLPQVSHVSRSGQAATNSRCDHQRREKPSRH